ncbi:Rrf2 family transcriptional regulator [Candidatus Symbiobacter mobilis]|uniref:Rrf2 family transcriptional regulator n=1 Tax=Candidatus Symbiobacter mobilis CR TaxID=946483 RepID=U5N6W2_9BURK|nr:RrF2 family transcriptional regulator [Candidatus Symbiobacter mobilis]AGX87025.1 Rrf2 family transcriptional regulator [Candidatus Symbiobacter mobilis CR]
MRLSSRGRFAVTAMVDLGLRWGEGPVSVSAISERQLIPLPFLVQLLHRLRKAALVESVRGAKGGFQLARSPAEVSVAAVLLAVEEPLDATGCQGEANCLGDGCCCLTHSLWNLFNIRMMEFLESVTLQHLVEDHHARTASAELIPVP